MAEKSFGTYDISNTEPLIRLNVEARADRQLMQEKPQKLLAIMNME